MKNYAKNYAVLGWVLTVSLSVATQAQMRPIHEPSHTMKNISIVGGEVGVFEDNTAYVRINGNAAKNLASKLAIEDRSPDGKLTGKHGDNVACVVTTDTDRMFCVIGIGDAARGTVSGAATGFHLYQKSGDSWNNAPVSGDDQ